MRRSFTIFLLVLLVVLTGCKSRERAKELLEKYGPLPDSPEKIKPLRKNDKIPDVYLNNIYGNSVSLRKEISEKPALIIFYRGGWCSDSSVYLGKLRQIETELLEMGFIIIAISPDNPSHILDAARHNAFRYKLLSDSRIDASVGFGLAYHLKEEKVAQLKDNGFDIESWSGEEHHIMPVPAVYIVDKNGIITFEFINPLFDKFVENDIIAAEAKAALKNVLKKTKTDNKR